MKLVKCYVSSFGKLKNYTYEFNDGLNTIKEDNGWGKSTLANFIKAMFYGLNDSKRSVSQNERLKFKPWGSNEKFGGYVQFIWGEKQFKLERFFGSKESEDTVELYDVETGKPYKNTENLGRRIFEIDEDGFLSTTYFSQKDFEVKSNTSLTAKFNAVCEIQDTDAFDKAVLKLENKAKTYKYRGDKGLISDAKNEIYYINDEIERANRAVNTVALLKEDEAALKREVLTLQQRTKILADKVESAGKAEALSVKKERYLHLLSEKERVLETKNNAEKLLNGNLPNDKEIKKVEEKIHQISSLSAQKQVLKSDVELLQQTMREQKPNKNISVFELSLYSLSGVFALLAIVLLALGIGGVLGWISLAVSVVLVASVVVKKLIGGSKQSVSSPYEDMLNAKNNDIIAIDEQIEFNKKEIENFILAFNILDEGNQLLTLENISKIVKLHGDLVEKLTTIEKELNTFEQFKSEFDKIGKIEDISLIKMELSRVQEEYSRKTIELANKRSAINSHEELASSFPELEAKKAEINEKIKRYEEEYSLINSTIKFLKQADENLKIKYRTPLQNSLRKYYGYIDNNSEKVNIDVDLKITVEEESGSKITDFYSKGYQNLFEICKRFALTDVLFTGEKPFIILDDPFYNLDDNKIVQALELLRKLSKDYQIIYLVCHESRRA